MKKIKKPLKRTENAAAVCIAGILAILGIAAGCSSKNSNELAQNKPNQAETTSQNMSEKADTPSQDIFDKADEPSQDTSGKADEPSQNTSDIADVSSQNTPDKTNDSAQITPDRAEETALSDAGLTSLEVTSIKTELDREDGIYVYEVKFYTDSTKYEYEINAVTGAIYSRKAEWNKKGDLGQGSSNGGSEDYITEENAKAIAAKDAGFSAADINFSKVKLDYEDGQRVYELEFYKDGREYEYEINALNGKIVKYEISDIDFKKYQ